MRRILLTLFLGLVVGFSPTSEAADPIQACAKLISGRLRLVSDPSQCKPTEGAVSWPGEASTPVRFQLVGFTTATFDGDEGVLGFTTVCQGEFGAGARFCTTQEVLETTSIPSGLVGPAWVMPISFDDVVFKGVGPDICETPSSVSGVWSNAASNLTGPVVDASGHFAARNCDTAQPVACCAPVP